MADATVADAHIVAARTAGSDGEAEGITLFLVPGGTTGVEASRKSMIDSRNTGPVTFASVEVTADAVLGEVDGGAKALEHVLNAGRAGLSAEMSGAAQECLGRTTNYLKERTQFGAIIGTFQALQHRAAHLYTEIE